jgi:hypothetical protein
MLQTSFRFHTAKDANEGIAIALNIRIESPKLGFYSVEKPLLTGLHPL